MKDEELEQLTSAFFEGLNINSREDAQTHNALQFVKVATSMVKSSTDEEREIAEGFMEAIYCLAFELDQQSYTRALEKFANMRGYKTEIKAVRMPHSSEKH